MKLGISIAVAAAVFATGCASIMTPPSQNIEVTTSNNEAIEASIDTNNTMTPGMVEVLRDGADKVARTEEEGCDNTTPVEKKIAPAFWGNILLGGVFGSTTDASTGKMWNYENVEIRCDNK